MSNLTKSTILFFILVIIAVFISGCNNVVQQPGILQNSTAITTLRTPISVKTLTEDQATKIIKEFVKPQQAGNLTYSETIYGTNAVLYRFKSDDAVFVISSETGRVQSAKWTGSGPVIHGISGDINQSCEHVGEFAKEKYPEIWRSEKNREMKLELAGKWPQSSYLKYVCEWYETLYYPNSDSSSYFTIRNRNSITVAIDPSTGMVQSYEETYVPLNSSLNLRPSISGERAGELAQQYFEKNEIASNQSSEQTNYGLFISTDDNDIQYLIWALQVKQHRNNTTYGGLIGIDAHDGHVVYHSSF